jgi:hypothetical protein
VYPLHLYIPILRVIPKTLKLVILLTSFLSLLRSLSLPNYCKNCHYKPISVIALLSLPSFDLCLPALDISDSGKLKIIVWHLGSFKGHKFRIRFREKQFGGLEFKYMTAGLVGRYGPVCVLSFYVERARNNKKEVPRGTLFRKSKMKY